MLGLTRKHFITGVAFGLLTVGLPVAAFAQTTTSLPSSTTTGTQVRVVQPACDWGRRIWYEPQSFHAGAHDGYYFWCGPDHRHSGTELHLRTTDNAGVHHYHGTLFTNGIFTNVEPIKLEPGDTVTIGDGGHTLDFSFVTARGIDGVDFNVAGGTHMRLLFLEGSGKIATSEIFLGKHGVHPAHDPVHIHRLRHVICYQASTRSVSSATTATVSAPLAPGS